MPLLGAGCADLVGDQDPREVGSLGMFHVAAHETLNTCGAGALGAQAAWEFAVRLTLVEEVLYWDTGTSMIPGTLHADGRSFAIQTSATFDMRDPEAGEPLPPCSLQRLDMASGTLSHQAESSAVAGFQGALSFRFAPTQGSDCADLYAGEAPIVASLPCQFDYSLNAARVSP